MKRFLRSVLDLVSGMTLGVGIAALLQFSAQGLETRPTPKFNVETTPVNRDARGETSYAPIVKKAAPSVVNIYSTRTIHLRQMGVPLFDDPLFRQFFGDGRQNRHPRTAKEQSLGSGVIVSSDGYILTANHVINGADSNGVKVALAGDGKEFTAKVIGTDPATDVAVLKVDAQDLPAITICDSDKLEVGDIVLAIGNPFGVGQTVTKGIVSALGRTALGVLGPEGYEDFIQTDAAINQGNSGGALVDAQGRLAGINTVIFSGTGGFQGVGFAVPSNLARSVMERLIKFGKVTRGFIGVMLQPEITPDMAERYSLPDRNGAMVRQISPNTPAVSAGLLQGDVIREVDGKKIADSRQLRLAISQTAPGSKVTLAILRVESGKKPVEKTVTLTLGELPVQVADNGSRMEQGGDNEPDQDALDGVEVTDLNPDVRRQYEIPRNVHGALVSSVDEDSNSAKAGLRQGDVVLEINHEPVRNADDAVELSKNAKGSRVLLRLWREGGSFSITVDNRKQK
jgi:serine protease Do